MVTKKDITDYIIKNEGPKVFVAKVSSILKSLSKERRKIVAELHQAADTLRTSVVQQIFLNLKNSKSSIGMNHFQVFRVVIL